MQITNVKDFLKQFYKYESKTNVWYAGSIPINDSDGEQEQDTITKLNSSWIDFIYYDPNAKVSTVYFDVLATNGKEPIVLLGENALKHTEGLIKAGSAGRYYLDNIALNSNGDIATSLFSLVEDAAKTLTETIIPLAFKKFIDKSKKLYQILKKPVIAVGRYVSTTISKYVGSLVGARVIGLKAAREIISVAIYSLDSTLNKLGIELKSYKKLLEETSKAQFKLIEKELLETGGKIQAKHLSVKPVFVIAGNKTLILWLSKILKFISIFSLAVLLPLEIGLNVANNLKEISKQEKRIHNREQLDSQGDIDFIRKATNLKVQLAFASSLSVKGISNKIKSRGTIEINKRINSPTKTIQGKYDKKLREVKQGIYKQNKQLTKITNITNKSKSKGNEIQRIKRKIQHNTRKGTRR